MTSGRKERWYRERDLECKQEESEVLMEWIWLSIRHYPLYPRLSEVVSILSSG